MKKFLAMTLVLFTAFAGVSFLANPAFAEQKTLGESGLAKYIPDCSDVSGANEQCRDVSVFLVAAIGIGRYLFTIIGALALLMFVYGGFTLILSRGAPDKVKQGFNILTAAIIGLVIAFSAYALVNYIGGKVLPVKEEFKLVE